MVPKWKLIWKLGLFACVYSLVKKRKWERAWRSRPRWASVTFGIQFASVPRDVSARGAQGESELRREPCSANKQMTICNTIKKFWGHGNILNSEDTGRCILDIMRDRYVSERDTSYRTFAFISALEHHAVRRTLEYEIHLRWYQQWRRLETMKLIIIYMRDMCINFFSLT